MFQTFEEISDPTQSAPRVKALRKELAVRSLDGFIVPHSDEFQNEYLPAYAERLSWLTGFTGSAGMAIVLIDKAAIFVDGRYTIQVEDQVDLDLFEVQHLIKEPATKWIEKNLSKGLRLGFDPWLHTAAGVKRLKKACEKSGVHLVACETNPLDEVWEDQPARPVNKVFVHSVEFSGEESQSKRERLAADLKEKGRDAALLTDTTSIAWLLNIRGSDVHHTPLTLAYSILHASGSADLFIAPEKVDQECRDHLGPDVTIRSMTEVQDAVTELGAREAEVLVDEASAAFWFFDTLEEVGAKVTKGDDPCVLPKAIKNKKELEGTRAAHIRDGAALTEFLAWLDREAAAGDVDEITAVKKLEGFRAASGQLLDVSFDTISGSGPHGAIVHYRVTEKTNRKLLPGELFLVDSGGQYNDGTTDVTRTVAIGEPTAEMKDRFTRVLKGTIGLAMARFPEGTTGAVLDILARKALWDAGIDYDHGTGHGVGSYLSVHEGPQGISKHSHKIELKPGMILSDEPGYYKTDEYGIRIENLVVVQEPSDIDGGERPMMGFETLTLAPIDRSLIVPDLLSPEERDWLNDYHARVSEVLSPLMSDETKPWLAEATKPV